MDHSVQAKTFEYYTLWLRQQRQLRHATIDGYLSHVHDHAKMLGFPLPLHVLRNDQVHGFLKAWSDEDSATPARLTETIPVSPDFMKEIFGDLATQLAGDITKRIMYNAALSFAAGGDVRGGEYAHVCDATSHNRLKNNTVAWVFEGDKTMYPITAPSTFPHGALPFALVFLSDKLKNSKKGAGVRGFGCAPPGAPFCHVHNLWEYFRICPPALNQPLFPMLKTKHINKVIRFTAVRLGLDPRRSKTHGIRIGTRTALNAAIPADNLSYLPRELKRKAGVWTSENGDDPYNRATIKECLRVSPFLYDLSHLPVQELRWTYMTPAAALP